VTVLFIGDAAFIEPELSVEAMKREADKVLRSASLSLDRGPLDSQLLRPR